MYLGLASLASLASLAGTYTEEKVLSILDSLKEIKRSSEYVVGGQSYIQCIGQKK